MAWSPDWSAPVVEAVGPVTDVRPLGAAVWRCRAGDRDVVVKAGEGVGDEAAGLRALAAVAGAPPVPEVLVAYGELLVTALVREGPRTPRAEEALGRDLADLHGVPRPTWGGGSSWIGRCPVDPAPAGDAADFYGRRLADLGARCGMSAQVDPVVGRLPELLPADPPALLHGDLWWGNVLWGGDGRAWLIDPSVHGGHPEEDLAMLGLFGPVPGRLVDAYREVRPLADGWRERVGLFQLVYLLVHVALFDGGYRASALEQLRRYR